MRFLIVCLLGFTLIQERLSAQTVPSFLGGIISTSLGKNAFQTGKAIARSDQSSMTASVMGTMRDGTISWSQPNDPDLFGYNGRCGEVAAANVLTMLHEKISPNKVARKMRDLFPGTSPSTLLDFINSESAGEWKLGMSNPEQAKDHMLYMLSRGTYKNQNDNSPFITLLSEDGVSLHWVTVVELTANNYVVYNENGKQNVSTLAAFIKMWGFQKMSYARRIGIQQVCCQPYSVIYQN